MTIFKYTPVKGLYCNQGEKGFEVHFKVIPKSELRYKTTGDYW